MARKRQTVHTFNVPSFFDRNGKYELVCCSMTGEPLYHVTDGKRGTVKTIQVEEIKELINELQLNLFK